VDVSEHIEALARDGDGLATAAAKAGLDAAVPTCPKWRVRDLVAHQGGIHRWAASYVTDPSTEPPGDGIHLAKPPDGDDALLDWFREGVEHLVTSLCEAGDDLECWTFLPAPFPRAFWARRQAHETAIHRVDAESAAGTAVRFDPAFAVDGIDELLLGFFNRPGGRLLAEPEVSLGVEPTDAPPDAAWSFTIGPQSREVVRGKAHGDCVVTGPAHDLYLLLWNRRDPDGLDVSGDRAVLDLWREKALIRFG